MSVKSERRALPVSPVNIVLSLSLVAAGVAQAIAGNLVLAVALVFVAVFAVVAARYARRPESLDIARVNAIEYRDERDRAIARSGFSVVGVAALLLTVVEILAVSFVAPEYGWLPAVQIFVLSVVWGVGNKMAADRG